MARIEVNAGYGTRVDRLLSQQFHDTGSPGCDRIGTSESGNPVYIDVPEDFLVVLDKAGIRYKRLD